MGFGVKQIDEILKESGSGLKVEFFHFLNQSIFTSLIQSFIPFTSESSTIIHKKHSLLSLIITNAILNSRRGHGGGGGSRIDRSLFDLAELAVRPEYPILHGGDLLVDKLLRADQITYVSLVANRGQVLGQFVLKFKIARVGVDVLPPPNEPL